MSNQKYNPKWDPKSENIYTSLPANTDEKRPDVRMVWLLNLIPYSGAGYFYALGFRQAIKPMVFIWIFLVLFGPGTLVPMYFILSVLGTAHILNKNRSTVDKLRHTSFGKEPDSLSPGQQIPMSASSEFSLSTLEKKAKKANRALKRMRDEDDEAKSKHAFEAFEYKAQAAEKMLRARAAAEANFAAAAAPKFDDEEDAAEPLAVRSDQAAPAQQELPAQPVQSDVSTDYISQVNNSYSIDAEVAGITAGVNSRASASATEVNNFLVQESKGIQSPNMVPEVSSQVASSESYVPDVTAQYSTAPLPLPTNDMSFPDFSAPEVSSQVSQSNQPVPEVSSLLVNSTQSTPDVSSMYVNSTQSTPDVSSMYVNSTQSTPDVSSMLVDSAQTTPDVSSMLVDSTQTTPDVGSLLVNSTQATPDVRSQLPDTSMTSFGNFESPKFSFSFEDHMATSVAGAAAPGATGTTTATPCPKCGAARDSNFSFCLACGQSFL
ncbi:MAG: hypothetical protein JST89_10740 [Cyanobacteria bacterium SZAS-4]|nr:hypothetical protein [Cyanobacteria bacterium SZAS-4]